MLDAGHLCLAVPLGYKIRIEDGEDRISVGWGCFVSLFFIEPTYSRYKSSWGCSYRGGYYLVAFFKSVVLELMKCFYQTDQRRASEGNGLLI